MKRRQNFNHGWTRMNTDGNDAGASCGGWVEPLKSEQILRGDLDGARRHDEHRAVESQLERSAAARVAGRAGGRELQRKLTSCGGRRSRGRGTRRHVGTVEFGRGIWGRGIRRNTVSVWFLVPEGRRRTLAGGKPARAGAAPGSHAPRAMPQRGIAEVFLAGGTRRFSRRRSPWAGRTASTCPGCPAFSSMPRWGNRATYDRVRGRRPLLRTCPRLISSGVPPGQPTWSLHFSPFFPDELS